MSDNAISNLMAFIKAHRSIQKSINVGLTQEIPETCFLRLYLVPGEVFLLKNPVSLVA